MTGAPVTALATAEELLYHLLVDQLIKCGIVVAALVILALGMTIIWKKAGPPNR